MRQKNKTGKIIALTGLVAVLVFGFVIIPRLMTNPPETPAIEKVAVDADSLAEPDAMPEDAGPARESEDTERGADSEEPYNSFLLAIEPDINQISVEQAFESAANTLVTYGYEIDIPNPLDFSDSDIRKNYWIIYQHGGDPIYDPVCEVYLRYDHVVPGEIDIQKYMDSEMFTGMSEAEIREIIDADDLSQIEYKPNTQHPKFKVLDDESCTIYFNIELNALTGEVKRGWATRVRLGEELSFGEASYFGVPIWDSDGYYSRLYY